MESWAGFFFVTFIGDRCLTFFFLFFYFFCGLPNFKAMDIFAFAVVGLDFVEDALASPPFWVRPSMLTKTWGFVFAFGVWLEITDLLMLLTCGGF